MLGGSFWVAMLRNGLSAFLLMTVFLLLDRPKLPMKKTILYYVVYGASLNFFLQFVVYGFHSELC